MKGLEIVRRSIVDNDGEEADPPRRLHGREDEEHFMCLHLRHPPREVSVIPLRTPDYDTLPRRFISSWSAGRSVGRVLRRALWRNRFSGALSRLNVAPFNFTRGRTFATSIQLSRPSGRSIKGKLVCPSGARLNTHLCSPSVRQLV